MMSSMSLFPNMQLYNVKNNIGTRELRKICQIGRHCTDVMLGVKYDSVLDDIAPYLPLHTYGHSFVTGREPV